MEIKDTGFTGSFYTDNQEQMQKVIVTYTSWETDKGERSGEVRFSVSCVKSRQDAEAMVKRVEVALARASVPAVEKAQLPTIEQLHEIKESRPGAKAPKPKREVQIEVVQPTVSTPEPSDTGANGDPLLGQIMVADRLGKIFTALNDNGYDSAEKMVAYLTEHKARIPLLAKVDRLDERARRAVDILRGRPQVGA